MANLTERYANALLELSEESGSLEKDLEQVIFVRDTIEDSEIQKFLLHPHISDSDKHKVFKTIFSDKIVNENLMGFLYLMVQKSRESLIVPALTEYIKHTNKRLGRIEARVVSAKVLREDQIESIRKVLSEKTSMQIDIKASVDPDVIAGFYILIDGHIFDGTVRSKINSMKERLKRA